jgi:hypothetical protein
VLAHELPFLAGQPADLVQDAVGNADLADVVQQRRVADPLDFDLVEAQRGGDGLAMSTTEAECSPV